MKIALFGYGKMGKEIEQIALDRGHTIVATINTSTYDSALLATADAAIDFSIPEAAFGNITSCIASGIPVVSGTTGWLNQMEAAKKLCTEKKGAFFYASNFSIGVNIFFELNKKLAALMNPYPDYELSMEEIHHTEKRDAPSGTAISLAQDIISTLDRKKSWVKEEASTAEELPIRSKRIVKVPGTHTILYQSVVDTIEIKHTAHNRKGFALGAVLATEWIQGKSGCFTMKDLLNL